MAKNSQDANIKLNSAEAKAVSALKKAQKEAVAEVKKNPQDALARIFGTTKAETK